MPIQTVIIRVSQADDTSPVIATTVTLPLPMQGVLLGAPSGGQAGAGSSAGAAIQALAAALDIGGAPTPVGTVPTGQITTSPGGSASSDSIAAPASPDQTTPAE
jgi:hypothetical protein